MEELVCVTVFRRKLSNPFPLTDCLVSRIAKGWSDFTPIGEWVTRYNCSLGEFATVFNGELTLRIFMPFRMAVNFSLAWGWI